MLTAALIVMASVLAALIPALSVTCTVNPKRPLIKEAPPIVPVALRLSPAGRVPELRDHEYGGDPPEAPSACE